MPTHEKEVRVAALRQEVAESTGIYLSEFGGIPVSLMSQLRNKMHEAGATLEVVKNRLLALALKGTAGEQLCEQLEGPTVATFCKQDPLAPAKVMKDFARTLTADKQRWSIKAAFVGGRAFAAERAQALADLPPAEEIKSGVVGAIAGPTSSVVYALNAAVADFVFTLQAIAEKREASGA